MPIFGKKREKAKGRLVAERDLSLIYTVIFIGALFFGILLISDYQGSGLREGDICMRTIYAPYDFKY